MVHVYSPKGPCNYLVYVVYRAYTVHIAYIVYTVYVFTVYIYIHTEYMYIHIQSIYSTYTIGLRVWGRYMVCTLGPRVPI